MANQPHTGTKIYSVNAPCLVPGLPIKAAFHKSWPCFLLPAVGLIDEDSVVFGIYMFSNQTFMSPQTR